MKFTQFITRFINFIKESRAELGKVTWSNRKQLISSTIVVMITVALVALFIGIIDLILSRVVTIILQ